MFKKLLLTAALIFATSNTAFALSTAEKEDFRQRVQDMPGEGRATLIAINTVTTVATCGVGGVFTGLSLVADTVPGVARLQAAFTENANSAGEYEYSGGVTALVVDLVTFALDLSDARMDESLFEEFPKAYDESLVAFEQSYNPNGGYCADQIQQLLILVGLL